ncbi:hypothetical protein ENBRE01_1169, partial [Enteropsectra breve]
MEGQSEKAEIQKSEERNKNTPKTEDKKDANKEVTIIETTINPKESENTPRAITLKAIIEETSEKSKIEWPGSVMKNIKKRLERMPRGGWESLLRSYNEKFEGNCEMKEFKNICKREDYKENLSENKTKRRKHNEVKDKIQIEAIIDNTLIRNAMKAFEENIEIIGKMTMNERMKTKKIPNILLEKEL